MREKILKSLFVIAFWGPLPASEQANVPVIFGSSEAIIKVADFPDTEDYLNRRGEYIDAGYLYRQFRLFSIPIWNYDGKWVACVGKNRAFPELTKEELDLLAAKANVKLPVSPSLPFWESIGGKLVFGLILLFCIGWKLRSDSISEESPPTEDM